MKKTLLVLTLTLAASASFGETLRNVKLPKACAAQLETLAINAEAKRMKADGEVLAGPLEASAGISYWPAKEGVSLSVRVEEAIEGRTVSYSAKVTKDDVEACRIPTLKRNDAGACRYSRHEGPESMTEIAGITWKNGKDIKAGDRISALEKEQILGYFAEGDMSADLNEVINATDDNEINTGTLTLPDGRQLTYMGAYGGDNPHGVFYVEGTAKAQGSNGDGSICIGY